jgi:hypothetical protein
MSSRGRPQLRALRALILAVPALVVGWWFWIKPRPAPSSYEVALDRALEPVLAGRELGSKLGAASPAQVRLIAREAAQTSIQYLAPRDLELWQRTRERVARASPEACARLWQGGSTEFFGPAVAALGDEPLQQYTEMLGRGLALRLERKPPPEPSPGALSSGLAAIAAALPADERQRFQAESSRRDLAGARACALFLSVSKGIEALEPATRTDFLRALAKGLQSAPGR